MIPAGQGATVVIKEESTPKEYRKRKRGSRGIGFDKPHCRIAKLLRLGGLGLNSLGGFCCRVVETG